MPKGGSFNPVPIRRTMLTSPLGGQARVTSKKVQLKVKFRHGKDKRIGYFRSIW